MSPNKVSTRCSKEDDQLLRMDRVRVDQNVYAQTPPSLIRKGSNVDDGSEVRVRCEYTPSNRDQEPVGYSADARGHVARHNDRASQSCYPPRRFNGKYNDDSWWIKDQVSSELRNRNGTEEIIPPYQISHDN